MDIVYYVIVFLLSYLLPFMGISKLFEMVGEQGWKAYIPVLNFVIWCKIIGRPVWYVALLLIPIVNIFILAGMASDLNKTFSRFSFLDNVLAVAAPFIWFPYMGFSLAKDLKYIGPAAKLTAEFRKNYKAAAKEKDQFKMQQLEREHPIPKKGVVREWADSIVFAVFAAHFIRLFLIEAYTIPTPSMEGSLLVGDFLFVSKAHYGSRMPMTPLSFPLLHNVMPITGAECYSPWPKWGYNRFPAIQKVKRYDPVVFNYPEGDSVFRTPNYEDEYYNQLKGVSPLERQNVRVQLLRAHKNKLVIRPVDKRDHYIKRCVGLPGDSIEVRAGDLYVNGQRTPLIKGEQHEYMLITKDGKALDPAYIKDKYPCTMPAYPMGGRYSNITIFATPAVAAQLEKDLSDAIATFKRIVADKGGSPGMFPYNPAIYPWNNDHYGPIWIPKKGAKVTLSMSNIELYQRIITTYEGNKLEIADGSFKINGIPTNEYTFKMDYYWMMGDNRHNSADSRSWGFVPDDHIVGKPLFVWLSLNGWKVRWNRLFMSANGM